MTDFTLSCTLIFLLTVYIRLIGEKREMKKRGRTFWKIIESFEHKRTLDEREKPVEGSRSLNCTEIRSFAFSFYREGGEKSRARARKWIEARAEPGKGSSRMN